MTADATVRHSPASPDPFDDPPEALPHGVVGRDLETGLAHDMVLQGASVLSLVGPAGVGTSTVAAAVAGRLVGQGWASPRALDLTHVKSPGEAVGLVAHAVASSRHSADQGVVLMVEGAGDHGPAVLALAEWVTASPGISLLLPTLAPLGLPREHTVAVHPWRTSSDDTPEDSKGVEFFLTRVRQRDPDFDPDAEDLGTIARIVHLVAGLPLAIELVARRVGPLSLTTIESQLARHTAPGPATVVRHISTPRHLSIRAALNWAATPLKAPTRRALWTSATFSSEFTLEAAAAVSDCSVSDMTNHVAVLVDLGLLESLPQDVGPARFRLPRLVWAHVQEMLIGDPALLHAATGRLMEYVADVAIDSASSTASREETLAADATLLVLRSDLTHLIDWTIEQRPNRAARLVSNLVPLALRHGDEWGLGKRLVKLIGTEVGDPDAHPEVLLRAAHLALRCSMADEHAIGWLTEGVDLARARGDHRLLLWGLALWMDAVSSTGDVDRTTAAVAEGLELSRSLGLPRWEARFEAWTAILHHRRFEHDLALHHGTRALEMGLELNDERSVLAASMALRAIPSQSSEVNAELPRLWEMWALADHLRDVRDSTGLKTAMVAKALRTGDLALAADCLEIQAKTIIRTGLWDLLSYTLFTGVLIATHLDDGLTAARWHGALAQVFDSVVMPLPLSATSWYVTSLDRVRAQHDPEEWDLHTREGADTPWPDLAIELLDLAGRTQLETSEMH